MMFNACTEGFLNVCSFALTHLSPLTSCLEKTIAKHTSCLSLSLTHTYPLERGMKESPGSSCSLESQCLTKKLVSHP